MFNDYGPMVAVHFTDPDGMSSEVCWMRDTSGAGAHPPARLDADEFARSLAR